MKFNFKQLPQLFKSLTKSGMADDVAKFAANNADEVMDVVDDLPTSISFDSITDAYKNRIPMDKPPITPQEFVKNYQAQMPQKYETRQLLEAFPEQYANAPTELDLLKAPLPEEPSWLYGGLDGTPDYDALDIRPERFDPDLQPDSFIDPDGFTDPEAFAKYYDSLEHGYISKQAAVPSEQRLRNLYNKIANGGYSRNFPDTSLSEEIAQAHAHYNDYFDSGRGDVYGAAESFQKLRDASMRAIRRGFKF